MKICVTGSKGFIGKHTVKKLVDKGHDVISIDRHGSNSFGFSSNICHTAGSVTDPKFVLAVFKRDPPDAVLHLAANSSLQRSVKDALYDAYQNVIGTLVMVGAAQRYKCKRFVFASTSAVYGPRAFGAYTEQDTVLPQVPYGISKAAGEMYIRASELSYAVLRYGNVYGPGQKPLGENILIARALAHLIDDEPFKINGDGEQLRDWVYVEDVADANITALFSDVSGTFNISTGRGTSVNDIITILRRLVNKGVKPIKHGPAKPGELREVIMDSHDAQTMLGWRAKTQLAEGLKRTYQAWTS
jgi:UDP-glucose 4-epimerase